MTGPFMSSSGPRPYPVLSADGLPGWVRADLRAMPTVGFDHATGQERWQGKSDFRSRRPVKAVRKIPVRSAERTGAGHRPPPSVTGRTAVAVLAVVVALVVWRRT